MLFNNDNDQDFDDSALANLDLNEDEHREGRQSDDIFEESSLTAQIESFVDQGDDVTYAQKPDVTGYDGQPAYEDGAEYIQKHFSSTLAEVAKHIDYFEPAYRFGFEAAVSDEYASDLVTEAEEDMRQTWEDTNPDTWERFKPAVLYGWKIGYMMTHDVEVEDPMVKAVTEGNVQESSKAAE